jgi:hypothetical protein
MRSPDHPTGTTEAPRDTAARWIREALDGARSKHDGWAVSMLAALGLSAKSYCHRWLCGEQQVPLAAVIASAPSHPEVVRHVARELALLVGMDVQSVADEHAHPRTLHDVIVELGDVQRAAADGERDGHLSVEDIDREMREWADVERVMQSRLAHLRRVRSERGGVVARIGGGR